MMRLQVSTSRKARILSVAAALLVGAALAVGTAVAQNQKRLGSTEKYALSPPASSASWRW